MRRGSVVFEPKARGSKVERGDKGRGESRLRTRDETATATASQLPTDESKLQPKGSRVHEPAFLAPVHINTMQWTDAKKWGRRRRRRLRRRREKKNDPSDSKCRELTRARPSLPAPSCTRFHRYGAGATWLLWTNKTSCRERPHHRDFIVLPAIFSRQHIFGALRNHPRGDLGSYKVNLL